MPHSRDPYGARVKPVALVALAFCLTLAAQDNTVTIRAGTLIDGKGGVLKNQQIAVRGGRIVSISAPSGKPTYDLAALTVLPGWIDTHVHIDWHFGPSGKLVTGPERGKEPPAVTALYAAENAWLTLQAGFTTVQSVGARVDGDVRDRINHGALPGPRILTSLAQITNQAGDAEAIRAMVRKLKTDGADLIKLFATSGLGAGGAPTMTQEQLNAGCGEAKAQGLRAIVHAISAEGARMSVLAGCTAVEHGDYIDDATLELMHEHGTYFDPNFLVLHNYVDNRDHFAFGPESFKTMEKVIPMLGEPLVKARKQHVKVVLGTDAVAGAHGHNAEEFVMRVRDGGDTPMDAIISGTSLAAESMGLGGAIGTLAPGYAADIVATDGNPLEDITAVRRIVFVMKDGKVIRNSR